MNKPGRRFALLLLTVAIAGCSPAGRAGTPSFDGDRAFGYLKKQVAFGPRIPDTQAHDATAAFIVDTLKPYADRVTVQKFTRDIRGKTLHMQNIVAHFNPKAKTWVLLAAHWDSRPTSDMEVDEAKQKLPVPGANDGASGVAVLLELARVFSEKKPDTGVVMVFFDGEDYGPSDHDMYLGAKEFAGDIPGNTTVDGRKIGIDYGILLDMIGDKDLNISEELMSLKAAPEIVKKVWRTAADLGYTKQFIASPGYSINDDHVPLIRAGLKCIDVIDFDYGPWHTNDDTPDRCSPASLKIVGDVTAAVVYGERG